MKPPIGAVLAVLLLAGAPASAGLRCHGVFAFDDGDLMRRFRCRYTAMDLRRARATCHDGEPGCDADGACDGACRFALCADAGCLTTFDVSVPLRRGGRIVRRLGSHTLGQNIILTAAKLTRRDLPNLQAG